MIEPNIADGVEQKNPKRGVNVALDTLPKKDVTLYVKNV